MSKRLTYEFVKESFDGGNYELLEDVYINSFTKMKYRCPNGHAHSISWDSWKQGVRCSYCDGQGKPTIEFIRSELENENCIPKFTEYKNAHTKLDYICPNGHEHSMAWSNWNSGYRCPLCAGNAKPTIEFIKQEFKKEGYILLSTEYINNNTKLDYVCHNGHKHFIIWAEWSRGQRCAHCYGNNKLTIDLVKKEFAKEGYILLSTEYKNNKQKLDYICPSDHKHQTSLKLWRRGIRCPKCSNNGTSKFEKEVKQVILDQDQEIIENDRTTIMGNKGKHLELDILLPCKTKAIECNGIYWHDRPEVRKNDKIKKKRCKELGIDLLVVTDKEWKEDKSKCHNKIKEFLM